MRWASTAEETREQHRRGETHMKRKKVENSPGVCPVCGSRNLEYGPDRPESDEMYYEWRCSDCGSAGREWYSLAFIEHTITRKGKAGSAGNLAKPARR